MTYKKNNMNIKTICIGLEHFIDKIGYQASIYKDNNENIRYLVNDVSGNSSHFIKKYSANAIILPLNPFRRILLYIRELFVFKPQYIELYLTGKLSIIYAIISKLFQCKLVVIVRGVEFSRSNQNYKLNYLCCDLANYIVAKEYNLVNSLNSHKYSCKTLFLPNAIPYDSYRNNYFGRDIDIIFLNSPRESRHVLFLIDVFKQLLLKDAAIKITIAGFSIIDQNSNCIEIDYQKRVLKKIENEGLSEKIQILGFVSNGKELLKRSKLFVFPADVIFCNYGLLEAMEAGCVPVIINGEGAEKIITNGVNGVISDLDVESFKESLINTLDEGKWNQLSHFAKETIKKDYSIERWYNKFKSFLKK